MFRGEKNTQWEGGYRVPTMIKWPGVIKPGTVINEIGAHEDMLTTFARCRGRHNVTADLLKGRKIGRSTYKVHLDGYDLGPALRGQAAWPRKEFIYWTDDGSVAALRYGNWKVTFLRAGRRGSASVWQEPFTEDACADAYQPAHGSVRAGRGSRTLSAISAGTSSACS